MTKMKMTKMNRSARGYIVLHMGQRARALFISLIALLTPLLVSCNDHTRATQNQTKDSSQAIAPATQLIAINQMRFNMELALTSAQRERGLSDRTHINEQGGMLFVFSQEQEAGFVMRRCLVPIDIIFAKEDGTITAMYEMKVEPYDTPERDLRRYPSNDEILFALEFKAGTLAKLGLKLGDTLDLPSPDLKARAK